MRNNDIVEVKIFGKKTEVNILSVGENHFDKKGDYKEGNFELTEKEIELINWLREKDRCQEYAEEIAKHCTELYSDLMDEPKKVSVKRLNKEITITNICINHHSKEENYSSNTEKNCYPDIAYCGESLCDEENGISINFLKGKFIGCQDYSFIL